MRKRGFTFIILIVAALQLALAAGAGSYAVDWLERAVSSGSLISASIISEHGSPNFEDVVPQEATPAVASPEPSITITELTPVPTPSPSPEIIETSIYSDVEIDNNTTYIIDTQSLLSEGLSQSLPTDAPQVLIIHTHGTESYTAEGEGLYEESDYARTTNAEYNVIKVGDVLAEKLSEQGLIVLHDTEYYDYPSYTGSYSRSEVAISSYLEQYPSIAIVIDLHRDAIGDGEVVYKTKAEIPDVTSSQLMLVLGTGENGLSHPNWEENLKLGLALQSVASEKYPTLMRPLLLCQERYNQQLTTGSIILEVGSNGNYISEAIVAVELFADAIAPVLLSLVE